MFAKANREAPYLSKKDRKILAETAKRVFLARNPNPERKGCPDPSTLRSLSFHKPTKDAMEVTLHLGRCSDCFRDALSYSQEFKECRRRLWLGVGTAAAVALVAGALYFGIKGFNFSRPPERIANVPANVVPVPVQPAPAPSITQMARAGTPLPVVDYRVVAPTRGVATNTVEPKALTLKREHLRLRIYLPLGSEEGTYEVRLHRASDRREVVKYKRTGDKTNSYILSIEDDFSKFAAGSYLIVVFAPGITGEIQGYPVRIVDSQAQ